MLYDFFEACTVCALDVVMKQKSISILTDMWNALRTDGAFAGRLNSAFAGLWMSV